MRITKRLLEALGGGGSVLTGFFCIWLALMDRREGLIMWTVWVGMAVLLILNGIAMLVHARRRTSEESKLPNGASVVRART